MTARELLQYSHEPYRQELIAGKLHEMEPAGALHGVVASRILRLLANHVAARGLGETFGAETGFHLASAPDTVRAPDASFVARDRIAATGIPVGFWPGPPDLAVEVVSPRDGHRQTEGKALDWLAAGTRAVVVLDPRQRTATVYRTPKDVRVLAGDGLLELDDVVPGFAPRVDALFV